MGPSIDADQGTAKRVALRDVTTFQREIQATLASRYL
jgi:hypothetical protein